jgi:membrane-anchored glycerophosphoryl diester phosphodiesterase (GDPDase)
LIAAGAGFVIIITAYLVAYMVALGATTLAVSEIYLGRIVTVSDVYARMRGRIGRLVILMLLMAVRIGVLSLGSIVVMAGIAGAAFAALPTVAGTIVSGLAVILGVIIGGAFFMFMVLRWGVAAPALVLEDLNARAAIKRSIEMTRGRKGRVFLLGVCTVVITYAVLLLVQVPFIMAAGMVGVETTAGFWLTIAGAVLGTIGTTFTGPLLIIGQALLYYDARIRDEGLDLQLMMAAIEGPVQVSDVARG